MSNLMQVSPSGSYTDGTQFIVNFIIVTTYFYLTKNMKFLSKLKYVLNKKTSKTLQY